MCQLVGIGSLWLAGIGSLWLAVIGSEQSVADYIARKGSLAYLC